MTGIVYLSLIVIVHIALTFCNNKVKAGLSASHNSSDSNYLLNWADEFNQDGSPDTSVWHFENGLIRNEEHQWYQRNNAWCENGKLIIEARRERVVNPDFVANSPDWKKNREYSEYTSANIQTRGSNTWQYGRFEMRARIDTSMGLWPAWWTLGITGEWPSCGEIDIMEYYRGNLLANVAHGSDTRFKAKWHTVIKPLDSLGKNKWSENFHTWRMDWDEKKIQLFVDDVLLNEVLLTELVNEDNSNFNPFMQKHFMLLNLAVGGANGGDPTFTSFPKRFEIDYVRVYQKKKN